MTGLSQAPGGLRAGQVSVVLLGRVIIGDIAVTLVDLVMRGLLAVAEDADDWLLTAKVPAAERAGILGHEHQLLAGLERAGTPARLSSLAPGFGRHMDKARSEIVGSAIHHGWIHHLHHDQRTSQGKELGTQVRAFQRDLRRATSERGEDVLAGPLLPYALRFGLVTDETIPLVRFAHSWVRALASEPGWAPPQPERKTYDVPESVSPAADPHLGELGYLLLAFGGS